MRIKAFFKKLFAIYAIQIVFFFPMFEVQAATYQATNVFGSYYVNTGGALGTAVAIGGLLTKANPYINALGMGVGLYQWALRSNDANLPIAVRGSNQPKIVNSWASNGNRPPTTYSAALKVDVGGPNPKFFDSSDAAGACAYAMADQQYTPGWTVASAEVYSAGSPHFVCHLYVTGTPSTTQNVLIGGSPQAACDDGYTVVGNSCNITNEAIVKYVNDSMADYTAGTDGAFHRDSRDADPTPSGTETAPTQFQQIDPYNSITMTPTPTGGVKVQTANQYTFNGDTYTYYQTTTTNNYGVVVDQTSSTAAGSIVSTTASSPSVITQSPVDTSNLATHADVNAVTSKLSEVKDAINCDTCTLPADQTQAQKDAIAAEVKKSTDSLDAATNDYGNYKTYFDWPTWVPTFNTASCSPMVGHVIGKTITWDLCPYIAKLNELIGWLMALFGAWTIVSMFFGGRAHD